MQIRKLCPRQPRKPAKRVGSEALLLRDTDAAKLKDLGSIEVTVHQVQVTGVCELSTVAKDLSSVGVVSEKAFKGKAISHSVK